MSLIPKHYFKSVVALEIPVPDVGDSHRCIGTGFLAGFETGTSNDLGQKLYQVFLVTNRHNFEDKQELMLRFNAQDGKSKRYNLRLVNDKNMSTWVSHPDQNVDVAAIPVSVNKLREDKIDCEFFTEDLMAFSSHLGQLNIAPGEHIFVLGFPMGIAGIARNYAIVRGGVIARLDEEILASGKLFLIDSTIFPGNSGGPVVIQPTSDCLADEKPVEFAHLIGMVKGYLPYEEEAISLQTGKTKVLFAENSGLALVVPVDLIRETVFPLLVRSKQQVLPPPQDNGENVGVSCSVSAV